MTTIHRDYRTLRRPQQILLNVAMRHSDVVLCNSYSTLRSLRDACQLDPAPILRVVYNGVDIRQLVAAAGDKVPRSNSNTHTLRIGSVGRFLPIKGFHDLLHAVGHLRQNNRDVHLTLVGDGPERTALRGLARELGIDKQVTFTGGVPRSEVYRLLHEMDVFVASSHSEGFCNAMVEAMAAGCAVVATDIPVFQELLGKDHPMYYDPGNVRQLAERLEHCVQAPAWSRHIGQQLQAQATARLSLAACTRNHLAVYRQLAQYARSQPATRELLAECHRKAA